MTNGVFGSAGGVDDGWPARAADRVEAIVSGVRDKTVRPLTIAARIFVYGVLIGIMLPAVIVFLAIGLIRLLDVYAFPTRTWASYAVVGGIFVVLGSFMWSMRRSRARG